MVNICKNILEQYLIVLSLPCGYRSKSIKFIISLLILILISILFTSGYYQKLINSNFANKFNSYNLYYLTVLKNGVINHH